MKTKNSKALSDAYPLIVIFIMLQGTHGVAQMVIAGIAALVTTSFIPIVADLAWAPLFTKFGLWWTSLFLGLAVVSIIITATAAGINRGGSPGIWHVLIGAATSGLFFSWVLAAMHGAEDPTPSRPSPDPTLIRSRLMRGKRRALQ